MRTRSASDGSVAPSASCGSLVQCRSRGGQAAHLVANEPDSIEHACAIGVGQPVGQHAGQRECRQRLGHLPDRLQRPAPRLGVAKAQTIVPASLGGCVRAGKNCERLVIAMRLDLGLCPRDCCFAGRAGRDSAFPFKRDAVHTQRFRKPGEGRI